MPADSLLQKLIHLDVLLRYKECDAALRAEIMEAQQDVLNMQAEMLRLLNENQKLRQDLAQAESKTKVAGTRSRIRLFAAKAS